MYTMLLDFNHWLPWSPWQIVEKEARIEVSEDSRYYEWEGRVLGAGNMTVLDSKESEYINYDLTFLKPWKSKSKIRFEFQNEGDTTKVTWIMESSLPFFLFFMKRMMEALMGMDFKRGLRMLKEYAEIGAIKSNLEIIGDSSYEGCTYIGIKTNCGFDAIDKAMERDFTSLMNFIRENHSEKISGLPLTIYHKWELVKEKLSYTACVPVNEVPKDLPDGVFVGKIPGFKAFKVRHTGPYEHIGNAWSAIYSRQHSKIFKVNKRIHPIELYLNSPKDTEPINLVAEILMPVI